MRVDNLSTVNLNRLGEDGWQLCGTVANGSSVIMWLKREKIEELPIEPDPGA
jgi:hypothetical protein